ncbi:MAG: saccharopine dehydrogenase NADP-binding domain-containing protein [Corynebacterium sp.]|uniref:saccharopine dehydrogenase family protein n=1 Tax=Corynebacterium sp. TaxID=1720 RepID=UPI0026DB5F9C|nr:saccharopine dehydrogenase NADP-binding domain-containing protein [Corynebacterium sp.]MDO5030290.1 saccharopine dehydrogenase NADP-binding domain-containing protein [Corynebacterium sp.]
MSTPATQSSAANTDRDHDIVVYGATGFVGRLIVEYLAEHAGDTRVALAGRNAAKLADVAENAGVSDWPVIVADATDQQALARLAGSTKVVLTVVGPYAKYGSTLVAECAKAGTHYVDLCGEVLFVHDSIANNHQVAQETGAKIVHSCGFDSIPSDVAIRELHEAAHTKLGETTLLFKHVKGGLSGGTIDSVRYQIEQAKKNPALRRIVADRYALAEPGPDQGTFGEDLRPARFRRRWRAPFFMAPYNTRIVQRSAYLNNYGDSFRYRELLNVGRGLKGFVRAFGFAFGAKLALAAMGFAPTAKFIDKKLPKPGEGPSAESRAEGRFTIEAYTVDTSGIHWRSTVSLEEDPGYEGTAMMISSAALALAHDDLPDTTGVLTPTVALGDALSRRLRAGGMTIEAVQAQ